MQVNCVLCPEIDVSFAHSCRLHLLSLKIKKPYSLVILCFNDL